ncbi:MULTISPECIES: transporter [Bacillus]|uniref:Transporter, Sodium/bile acid symporter family n=3 Tax=Bacillus cereus group TaxID=86661 RepID=Q813A4_BACCR|nr:MULTISPECIES: transporter [Bacillus]MCO4218415.1 transporter [Bacillus sp. 10017]MCX2702302.1 transporter [Bacillus sp. AS_5]MEB4840927.1 transporter [Paenibacillus jamilae]AAP10437.1 Transporter, Sodium/bile acid symporter family [Bacillus cereus ATCC 14579]EEL10520.1 Transporter, Sodium/bile acid symporter [Bacillus cereus BDRD-Cer4]
MHFGPAAALPSVLAAVWHNIAGPILATIWSKNAKNEKNTFSDENVLINIEK